jgi:inorganic pyrophosphatase
MTLSRLLLCISMLSGALAAQSAAPPQVLPAAAAEQLAKSLDAAGRHRQHVWRDTPAFNADGTFNGFVVFARGVRRKFLFDMRANERAIDRVIPEQVGGYPVNYGFVPQTVSVDGDPFDVLVLGPALPGGTLVRGVIVGLMQMDDDKGPDSKVVIAAADGQGRPRHELTSDVRDTIAAYFNTYKAHEPGKFSRVVGWGSADDGRVFVRRTNAFFLVCRRSSEEPCRVDE